MIVETSVAPIEARSEPDKVARYLTDRLREELGEAYSADFQPPYAPWDQRLCLVPDSDFFEAVKAGKASIVTGHIESFENEMANARPAVSQPNIAVPEFEAETPSRTVGFETESASSLSRPINGEAASSDEF